MVEKNGLRSNSSGKVFKLLPNIPSWKNSLQRATDYVYKATVAVSGIADIAEKFRGKSDSTSGFSASRCEYLWVKMDGDRASRMIAMSGLDTFDDLFKKMLLKVVAPGSTEEYCLVDGRDRLMESIQSMMKATASDLLFTILKKKDAFVQRV